MDIAYILHTTELSDGSTKAFLNMLDGLLPYGVKPHVILPDRGGVFHELNNRHIPTLVLTYRPSAYPHFRTWKERILFIPRLLARIIVNRRASRALLPYCMEHGIKIVHTNTGTLRVGYDVAHKMGVPHLYHIREFADLIGWHYFPTKKSFLKQFEANRSYSICVTRAVQQHYALEEKGKSSRVIYDGVFHVKDVMPSLSEKNYFLFAGRIQPAKGLEQLLQAYQSYVTGMENPLPLKVAGSIADGAYYQSQMDFVRENRLTENVEFLGHCDDLSKWMQAARALIISSPFEGFGFCMPEAMCQGCLVIGRNTSGTKEQMDNGLAMEGKEIALRYATCEQLAAILSEVATHPVQCYDDYTQRAFRVVNHFYTQETNAKEIYHFYKDII